MIIDTILFYNELDMLEFRLMELNSVVDKFVIVEATKTFSGNKKPLYFELNKKRFKKYLHKIHYTVLSTMPRGTSAKSGWMREYHHRIATGYVLKYLDLKNDDIVIAADVDEIPDVDELKLFKKQGLPKPILSLLQDTYYYNIENKALAYSGYDMQTKRKYHKTIGIKVFYWGAYLETKYSMQNFRFKYIDHEDLYEKGGWHLTFFMTPNKIKEKMENYGHQEYEQKHNNLIKSKGIKFENINIENNTYLPKNYKYWL